MSNENSNQQVSVNILVGATGSVATIKLLEVIQTIKSTVERDYNNNTSCSSSNQLQVNLKVVLTNSSKHFVSKSDLLKELASIELYDDADEWNLWKKMGDPVLHIELRKWADLFVIAPLDANTMAKLANGISDNLLTCVVRAWDPSKPLVYCPAMNVHMYEHRVTGEHLRKLQSFGYIRIDCVEKKLACGDFGLGAMASPKTIAEQLVEALRRPKNRNKIQQVPRYISNFATTCIDNLSKTQLMNRFGRRISNLGRPPKLELLAEDDNQSNARN